MINFIHSVMELINEFFELRNQRKISLKECPNCKNLFNLLENERRERFKLIESFSINRDNSDESNESSGEQPIKPITSWAVKRHQLEMESKKRLDKMNELNTKENRNA